MHRGRSIGGVVLLLAALLGPSLGWTHCRPGPLTLEAIDQGLHAYFAEHTPLAYHTIRFVMDMATPALQDPPMVDSFCIKQLHTNAKSGRFTAAISLQVGDPVRSSLPDREITLYGRVEAYQTIPILRAALPIGNIITKRDIVERSVNMFVAANDVATTPEQVLGRTAKQAIAPGKPIMLNYLVESLLVKKDEPVVITYRQGTLQHHADGIALSSGTLGTMVQVENTRSHLVLDAEVIGMRQVQVSAPSSS